MHPEELRETIQDYLDSLEITRGLEDMLEEDVLELIMRRLLVENGLEMEQEEEIRAIVREELERRKGIKKASFSANMKIENVKTGELVEIAVEKSEQSGWEWVVIQREDGLPIAVFEKEEFLQAMQKIIEQYKKEIAEQISKKPRTPNKPRRT